MLSVLIPFYQWEVADLIKDVLQSSQYVDLEVEIIACDDHSPDDRMYLDLKTRFQDNPGVQVIRNPENLGRSGTRNRMVDLAKGDTLIFIDGDSRLSHPPSYLRSYVEAINERTVVVGGTAYSPVCPDERVRLHWHYGRCRESKPAALRNQTPLRYFFTNNFGCHRTVFDRVKFDENLMTYGYEDTKWAKEVEGEHFSIIHIDNTVQHMGLKRTEKFLQDALDALRTLAVFYKEGGQSNIKLLQMYRSWNQTIPGRLTLNAMAKAGTWCFRLLLSGKTTYLLVYDVFRMGSLHQMCKKESRRTS